jgi:hypothetical protein
VYSPCGSQAGVSFSLSYLGLEDRMGLFLYWYRASS